MSEPVPNPLLQPTPKDALNNSFPGVLRLGYFSDGANLS